MVALRLMLMGAESSKRNTCGVGIIVRDDEGCILEAMAKKFNHSWSIKAFPLCSDTSFGNGVIELDCKEAVNF